VRRDDRGESLIDLIVAMAILGTTMVAVIGSFLSLSKFSGSARDRGKAMSALVAGSEYAKNCKPSCVYDSALPTATVPHDNDTTIIVSSGTPVTLDGGTNLTAYVVTVTTESSTLKNTVVLR
jgi:type II secretory pathway pseudopilin PulG